MMVNLKIILLFLDNSKDAYWYLDEEMKGRQKQPEVGIHETAFELTYDVI